MPGLSNILSNTLFHLISNLSESGHMSLTKRGLAGFHFDVILVHLTLNGESILYFEKISLKKQKKRAGAAQEEEDEA